MTYNDPVALALSRSRTPPSPQKDRVLEALVARELSRLIAEGKKSSGGMDGGMGSGSMGGQGGGELNSGMGALGEFGQMGGGMLGKSGGFNSGTSPWDALFTGLGSLHGRIDGNDPNTPMVPGGRRPHGSDKALIGAGGPIGGAIGSVFGFGGAGSLAGQNVGATLSDVFNGDVHNLGLDVSQNLPPLPGMKQPGWKGLMNGATGLPFGTLFGKLFGG